MCVKEDDMVGDKCQIGILVEAKAGSIDTKVTESLTELQRSVDLTKEVKFFDLTFPVPLLTPSSVLRAWISNVSIIFLV